MSPILTSQAFVLHDRSHCTFGRQIVRCVWGACAGSQSDVSVSPQTRCHLQVHTHTPIWPFNKQEITQMETLQLHFCFLNGQIFCQFHLRDPGATGALTPEHCLMVYRNLLSFTLTTATMSLRCLWNASCGFCALEVGACLERYVFLQF